MKTLRIFPLFFFVLIMSISGVYATWVYCSPSVEPVSDTLLLTLGVYEWDGSDVLPDDEEAGLAHANLIDQIINGEGIGLNSSNSYLNQQISMRESFPYYKDTLGSMAITQGDRLNELFDLGTENVTFLIQMLSDNTYYLFTTSADLGTNGNPNYAIGTTISPIYRTTVSKTNGVWEATITEEGSAASAYYKESQIFNDTRSKIPSFDPNSWKAT